MKLWPSILQLFRSLIPYWKFFDRFGYVPRLFYRFETKDQWSEWQDFHPQLHFSWFQLFHNPHVNLVMWEQSLLSQLVDDTKEVKPHQVENLETYLWVRDLVADRVQAQGFHCFQFEIRGRTFIDGQKVEEPWLTSPEHTLEVST